MSKFDYHAELGIDPLALDVEWLRQPKLFMKYAEACADARNELEHAARALEVCKAETDRKIRQHPEKYIGEKKLTEGAVEACINTDEVYNKKYEEWLEAKHSLDILVASVKAFDQRKDTLENLVRLYGQQYFAGPESPREIGGEWEKKIIQDSAHNRIDKALNKKESEDGGN